MNRPTPDEMKTLRLAALALAAACAPVPASSPAPPEPPWVRPGVEVFLESPPAAVLGKRVGLVTNQTGVDRARTLTIDRLAASDQLELVALFSPEHGIRGAAAPGEKVASGTDERTGLPIHSLYGDTRRPTPEMLRGVEALVFDIQDIGARPYTYVYTMALAMQAAAGARIPFVVLDRPNPINGVVVEGNQLDTAFATFVGMYPIPVRHGMTAGELAQLFNREFGIGAELVVVPAEGWRREAWFDRTGLPWVPPSPNIPRLESAIHYPGTVFFEGTNLSVGRGSSHPFEQVGAPWLDAFEIAREMNGRRLPGVRFEAVGFTPQDPGDRKFAGQPLRGVRLVVTHRDAYRPVSTSLVLLDAIFRRHREEFQWLRSHFDRLAGTDQLRLAVEADDLAEVLLDWEEEAERFAETRKPYLLYP
ncbi:MAG TPA: DUF1343 domain-containing protein [Longimicrobiaceae bacterium]|nr:DUF1343 domain-containing protein [Longimicrobiaceae bacterium]